MIEKKKMPQICFGNERFFVEKKLVLLKRQCHENFFLTDVPHPILTSEHSPFNLLRSFQVGVHRSKTDLRDFIIV